MQFLELVCNDIDSVNEILKSTDYSLENYFLNSDEIRYKMFGCIDVKLSAVVGIIDSITVPAWILSRSHTRGSASDVFFVLNNIIDIKERNGLFQFFTLSTDEEIEFLKSKLDNRYQSYLDHIVPADSLTGYENIDHDVLEYKKYPTPLKIYNWVLKNEYRPIKK